MVDICCVGSGVKCQSLSYWSIVMTSMVEFSTGEFRAKQVGNVLEKGITNQGNTTFRKSRKELYSSLLKVAGEETLNAFVDIGVRNLNNQKFNGQGGSKERACQSFEGKQS